ncbi:hypothetical protein PybrP1_011424 [[Pythium] brassicae (nom. inval.)]|nr:hypothetical protein PybrP1_011424 [[Pythium] brassicae (nom. inval.)]
MLKPLLSALVLLLAVARATIDHDKLWSEYTPVPTACESPSCVAGGCLYENCEQPVSCKGGMCFFRNCKEAVCEGGVCVFDHTAAGRCSGGACRFQNMETTLTEGYCAGGACTLEGQPHPASFAATLSE